MKIMAGLAVAMVLAGAVRAEPVRYLAERAETLGEAGLGAWLSGLGITNAADQAEIAVAWEEDAVVDVTLRSKAYAILGPIVCRQKCSARNLDRIRDAVLAERPVPAAVLEIVRGYPVVEREGFREACMKAIPTSTMASRPTYARLYVDTVLIGGQGIAKGGGGVDAMVEALLAGEYMALREAAECKTGLKAVAVKRARKQLHTMGFSFVVQNGVNPAHSRDIIECIFAFLRIGRWVFQFGAIVESKAKKSARRSAA